MTSVTQGPLHATGQRRLHLQPGVLFLPMAVMLLVVYILPTLWFFIQTARNEEVNIFTQLLLVVSSSDMLHVLWNTVWIAALVTACSLLCAYPLAYGLCHASRLTGALILICIIVPYFTSVVVRTYSWMVILGQNGLINQFLMAAGMVKEPVSFMYNRVGVLIRMVYVLLPYLVLTLYAVMKSIDNNLMRAAYGMGASGWYTFRRIFLPLSAPGMISGCLIVFILAIAFFVTPALMGGSDDLMIAMLIQREIEVNLNWGLAAVMSFILLAITLVLFVIYCRYTDIDGMMNRQ